MKKFILLCIILFCFVGSVSAAVAPIISNITPTNGAMGGTVTMTISGSGFQNGATVKMIEPGYPSVNATGVSISPTSISCTFSLSRLEKGTVYIRVTNPDGQYVDAQNSFTINEASDIPGWYTVHCNVDGAQVYFDGVYKGDIGGGILNLIFVSPSTPYKNYAVSKTGYTTWTASLTSIPKSRESIDLYATLNSVSTTQTTNASPAQTIIPITALTTIAPTTVPATINYSATIAAMQSQIAAQGTKIEEQGTILNQIMIFLRNLFGWK